MSVTLPYPRDMWRKTIDESSADSIHRRKTGSRLTNYPFETVGKKDDGFWILTIKNGTHNHEPLKDISQHPSARRFTEREGLLINEMTEAGSKPRQILKQGNPKLLSTPKHVYNVRAKLRQRGVSTDRYSEKLQVIKTSKKSVVRNNYQAVMEPSWRLLTAPVSLDVIQRNSDQQSLIPTTWDLLIPSLPSWRNTLVTTCQRIMFKFQELIWRDMDKLAMNITTEHGKTLEDAPNDVLHGLDG
ncbi:hypothetical protein Patl1_37624 [Pistacia atlantica]|nr:hypothetical protein Patl1_37624 [Pistacia atlantica]